MTRRAELLQEWLWRDDCANSLATFAKTMPIPGVPQTDNYEYLLEQGNKPDGEYDDDGKFQEWYDGRYDSDVLIAQINTAPAEHHILIYDVAQKIIEGNMIDPEGTICRRGMFMGPPGMAKSTCLDVVAPAWAMGKFGHEIILASCADMIAKKHGKRARQLCNSEEYQAVFETQADPDTKAADNWALRNGARYLSAGIHGALMGNRADGLVPDDLLKGRRAAESQVERDNAWIAYTDDARTRKKPTAWELQIGTRWHQDDVMGRILPEDWAGESGFIKGRDGHWWYVVCLQAQCEHDGDPLGRKVGEYLWEEWFNYDGSPERYWSPLKIDTRAWSSLYQQVPTPAEGEYFKQSWVRYYDFLPQNVNYYVSADYATSEEKTADLSSIGLWAVDGEGQVYFVAGWHGRQESIVWVDTALDYVELKGAVAHIAGKGSIRRMSEGPLKVRMRKRKVFTELIWYEESYSKEVNAKAFQMMMASGMVLWPKNDEEAEFVIRHLTSFGTIKIDDPVDMCAMMGRHMARLWGPAAPKDEEPPLIIEHGKVRMSDMRKNRKKKGW